MCVICSSVAPSDMLTIMEVALLWPEKTKAAILENRGSELELEFLGDYCRFTPPTSPAKAATLVNQ
jgi:hypothetical protein